MLKKIILIIIIAIALISIGAYLSEAGLIDNDGEGVACTMDAMQCPDGSYVGRTGPNCEFAQCPNSGANLPNQNPGQNNPGPTACTADAKICPDGSAVGRTGPNCEFSACPTGGSITCTPEQNNAQVCTKIYQPVCGYVSVQCVTTPCDPVPQTFGNACEACSNSLVNSYTPGACY